MTIKAGDILSAREAILLAEAEAVDLSPPIEIPPIPPEAHPNFTRDQKKHVELIENIQKLKRERKAIILAHNYMPKDIQDIADVVGDSLLLAQKGKESNATVLVEASVRFMQDILAVMKKPHQTVLAPDLGALCSLAAHAKPEKVLEWKEAYPDGIVISYVNTDIRIKAISDYCCASANSPKVIRYATIHHPDVPILFLPDVYLGLYAADILKKAGESIDRLWLMMGACHVHDRIKPSHVEEELRKNPGAAVVAHSECSCVSSCIQKIASGKTPEALMQIRSTQGMIDFVRNTPSDTVIMATEVGNIYPIEKAIPGKRIIPASKEAICAFMKQNTLEKVYASLRDLKYEITVDRELAERARIPIEKMLAIV
ncbi:MAG: quinolinate synthase NadA [bacterium]|nr:quinolinate synthase NadA [bacterium]